MSGSSIFAGAVAAVASWALLCSLGVAIGLTAAGVRDLGSMRVSSFFIGAWGAFCPLLALFIGGLVSARGSGTFSHGLGALHGFVTWGLTTIGGLWLAGTFFLPAMRQVGGSIGAQAAWGVFGALFLGLLASLAGGLAGTRSYPRRLGAGPRPERRVVRETPLTEVYP